MSVWINPSDYGMNPIVLNENFLNEKKMIYTNRDYACDSNYFYSFGFDAVNLRKAYPNFKK